ncbi:bifunctional ADP-dependent NAD(P)H-hydrate dehydratase/NAD(P)H-hydrate epimerase, partial [Pseudomonas sp. BGM005]|nr:bifunctional ADP-dependent NAD(P)H-hydrate dehydratase/NAD(P)H-hydrate epimerase [Pseudomonas sp. BG5]
SGANVALFHLGDPAKLKGDAAHARAGCALQGQGLELYGPENGDVVVDGLFGAGLARPVPTAVRTAVEQVAEADIPVLAIDLPSGLDGRTGKVLGAAFRA